MSGKKPYVIPVFGKNSMTMIKRESQDANLYTLQWGVDIKYLPPNQNSMIYV